jgi:Big-like domain-containing protein
MSKGVRLRYPIVALVLGVLAGVAGPSTVDAAPTVSISAISTASGAVWVTATVSTWHLARIELYQNGRLFKTCTQSPCSHLWNSASISAGIHTLQAKRYDTSPTVGVVSSTVLKVVVNNAQTLPTVTVSVPSTASGTVTLQAAASAPSGVALIKLYVDGSLVKSVTGGSLTHRLNTTRLANGKHIVQAWARTLAGKAGPSAYQSMIVRNAVPTAVPTAGGAIPELSRWESQMVTFGQQACAELYASGASTNDLLVRVYYDMTRVMYQIADYTRDASWNACASRANEIYRDRYVIPNKYQPAGYWLFSTGLRLDHQRTGVPASKNAVIKLSQEMYASDWAALEWTESWDLSREVAYAILSYLDAEALGAPHRARRAQLVDQAYEHLDQWFVEFDWVADPKGQGLSPFAVGLTAQSLIRDWEQTGDPRLIPALRRAADWMWANAWLPREEAMWYASEDQTPAPDLNLLVAPIYAFLYHQTGLTQYRDQGDALFAGGVRRAWLDGNKQFNQNYWWSFDYVRWRN